MTTTSPLGPTWAPDGGHIKLCPPGKAQHLLHVVIRPKRQDWSSLCLLAIILVHCVRRVALHVGVAASGWWRGRILPPRVQYRWCDGHYEVTRNEGRFTDDGVSWELSLRILFTPATTHRAEKCVDCNTIHGTHVEWSFLLAGGGFVQQAFGGHHRHPPAHWMSPTYALFRQPVKSPGAWS
jgi:hypothetical protein